jgi:hypothetical protein
MEEQTMFNNVVAYRVFAMMRARRLVKDDIKRKGHKTSQYTHAELETMARMYLELHPELAQQAKADVDMCVLRGDFGKRAQRQALAAQTH